MFGAFLTLELSHACFPHRRDRFHRVELVPELLAAGHSVLGLTRSNAGAKALTQAGAEPYRGTLEDPHSLGAGAAQADAVIHCAFDHDFSNFVANCEKDARAIRAMGEALKGSQKLMLITSGTGIGGAWAGTAGDRGRVQSAPPQPAHRVGKNRRRACGRGRKGGGHAPAAGS